MYIPKSPKKFYEIQRKKKIQFKKILQMVLSYLPFLTTYCVTNKFVQKNNLVHSILCSFYILIVPTRIFIDICNSYILMIDNLIYKMVI